MPIQNSWLPAAIAFLALSTAAALPAVADPLQPAETMVHVQKPAGDGVNFSHGSGVHLGNGLILTAAHVIKVDPGHPQVKLQFVDHTIMDGMVIFDGTTIEDDLDLALIQVDPAHLSPGRQAQPGVTVCPDNPRTNTAVSVVAENQLTSALTIAAPLERRDKSANNTDGWTNLLTTGYHHGASGGGIFDPNRRCLEGIISLELVDAARHIDMTSFIPASRIAPFLGRRLWQIDGFR